MFASAYIAAVVFVASGLDREVGEVVLVLAAGMRLASYIGGTAGELGFLRGFWLDASRRLVWLEDYAARRRARVGRTGAGAADCRASCSSTCRSLPGHRSGSCSTT